MRVLFITGEFPPQQGGVGDCTHALAKALAALGVETHVLTSTLAARFAPGATLAAMRVQRLVPQWDWRSISIMRRVLRATRADIAHIQYQTAAFGMHPAINFAPRLLRAFPPAALRSGGWGVRFVTTFHDLRVPYLFPKAGRVREWVTFELARSSAAVIATNEEDYARLATKLYNPVALIPIGSNIAPAPPPDYDRAAWRARWGIAPHQILLAYFGFLNDSKGGETLIRALAQIPDTDAKLLMIGGQVGASDPTNAAYRARVKKLIAELGLTARVLWSDYTSQAEVSANLLAADMIVLPYRDGASFRRGSFMAALAHGLPIVTTSRLTPYPLSAAERGGGVGGSRVRLPALRDGENVLLVPPDDPAALAAAITRLAAAPELRARTSQGAHRTAAHFTWDKIAAQHLELYKRVRGDE